MSDASLLTRRELLAMLLFAALLVRPRFDATPPGPVPAPAIAVVERRGRLEATDGSVWAGHTTAAVVAEGPPYCWAAMDRALLGALGATPAIAAALLRFRDAGGLPDAAALRTDAGLTERMALRWAARFRTDCHPRDFAFLAPSTR